MFRAEIAKVGGSILVSVFSKTGSVNFSRSFHGICDAERWLSGLAKNGLRARDLRFLSGSVVTVQALHPLGAIEVSDLRPSRRVELPLYIKG